MSASNESAASLTVTDVMATHGFTPESCFYRYTHPEHLTTASDSAASRLTANPDPPESVLDVYGGDHITAAVHVGAGLAFADSADNEWNDLGRICVKIRLQDILDQGGRIYPVESIITTRTWYCTLPKGEVEVCLVK